MMGKSADLYTTKLSACIIRTTDNGQRLRPPRTLDQLANFAVRHLIERLIPLNLIFVFRPDHLGSKPTVVIYPRLIDNS